MRKEFAADPDASIADLDFESAAVFAQAGAHANRDFARLGKLDRVDRQVERDRSQRMAADPDRVTNLSEVKLNSEIFALVRGLQNRIEVREEKSEINFLLGGRLGLRLRDCEIHHVLDGLREFVDFRVHPLDDLAIDWSPRVISAGTGPIVAQDIEIAEQRLYRRAQLMREVAERFQMYAAGPSGNRGGRGTLSIDAAILIEVRFWSSGFGF